MDSAVRFVQTLVEQFPVLKNVYVEHLHDFGEVLPHVFMGAATRFVVTASDGACPPWLPSLMRVIEDAFQTGPAPVQELIGASFVENLSGRDDAIRALRPLMGPKLLDALHGLGY